MFCLFISVLFVYFSALRFKAIILPKIWSLPLFVSALKITFEQRSQNFLLQISLPKEEMGKGTILREQSQSPSLEGHSFALQIRSLNFLKIKLDNWSLVWKLKAIMWQLIRQ